MFGGSECLGYGRAPGDDPRRSCAAAIAVYGFKAFAPRRTATEPRQGASSITSRILMAADALHPASARDVCCQRRAVQTRSVRHQRTRRVTN